MSMLAERKRKTKWIINPTKKPLWTTDSNGIKFGKELMEKMGWSAGKGLGANEQGIQEPLKVSYKNDTKGMGFKGNDDEWIEHQDEFNLLLDKLRNESCVSKTSESEKNEMKSLEEKSKQSRARVHYQRFTRGKDLSRYSENDLACILGTNKLNKKKAQLEEDIHTDLINDTNFETSFGVTTINSGSIQNYFKKKWISHKKPTEKLSKIDGNPAESSPSEKFNFSESFESKAEKKISNGQYELQSEVNILELNKGKTSESEKCKKKKRNTDQNEPAEKKRKENSNGCILKNDTVNDIKYHLDDKEEDVSMKNENLKFNLIEKKTKNKNDEIFEVKKKKKKVYLENSENFHEEYLNEELGDTKKCKRKDNKDIKSNGSCRIQCDPDKSISEQVSYKKKKKKFKKEKLEDNEEIKDTNFSNDQNGELIEVGLKIKSSEDKKEKSKDFKKSKRERFSGCSGLLPNNEYGEVGLEVESSKKKQKEDKRGISEDNDKIKEFSSNLKILPNSQNNEVIKLGCEAESSNKKKRKKEERKKSEHNEQIRDTKFYSNNQDGEVNELCSVIKSNKEKKKKEKEKKLKDYEVIEEREYSSFQNTFLNNENSLEVESAVRKKNKTNKREKLVRNKDISDENSDSNKVVHSNDCNIAEKINSSVEENVFVMSGNKKVKSNHNDLIEEVYIVEGFAEKKSSRELTNILEVGSSNKKKKDQQEELKDALNRENTIEEPVGKNDQTQIPHAKKSSKGRCLNNSNNVRNDESAEGGVYQHKLEFLNEKRADKFYPGQYTNDRVQRLLCWVNFSEFKGSNLENVTGYGCLLKCENKPR